MDYIKYKDKEFPFVFGWAAFKEWHKSNENQDELTLFEDGCYLGFKYGAKKEGQKIFKKEEMLDMFEDDSDFQEKTFSLFTEHLGKQKKILEITGGKIPR